MQTNLLTAILIWVGFALAATTAVGDGTMSDTRKKEIVYEMYAGYKKKFPGVKDVSPPEAMAMMKQGGIVFVDTRKPEEMEVSMLPGAITESAFRKEPEKYAGKMMVAYCTISYRSGLFAQEMTKKGIPVINLSGGLLAWVLEGGNVYDADGETNRIHVYGKKWNYPPAGYESVMFGLLDQVF